MNQGLTPSEKLVTEFCGRAFMRLWTHPNPVGKKGKELCDCLVVCGRHIIILSVKEIQFHDTPELEHWERWHKAAVEKSVRQIWGAERWLAEQTAVERRDGRKVELPPVTDRVIHRISVSLGDNGKAPFKWGNFGHGFVHVLDDVSLRAHLQELDTITDFIDYLTALETLVTRKEIVPVYENTLPHDFLAMYMMHGETFGLSVPDAKRPDMIIFSVEGAWQDYAKSQERADRAREMQPSSAWDALINAFAEDLLTDGMFDMHSRAVTKNELALLSMALQPRNYRASLGEALIGFLGPNNTNSKCRVIKAANSTAFVFLEGSSAEREHRARELVMRCTVVRNLLEDVTTIVGIAMDKPGTSKIGYASDIAYLHFPEWPEEQRQNAERIRAQLGYFKDWKPK